MRQLDLIRLIRQLVFDEGEVLSIYLDPLGHKTVGVGHLLKPGDAEYNMPVGTPISEIKSFTYFVNDLFESVQYCRSLYPNWNTLPDFVQEVLVNMMFNLGPGNLKKFKKMNKAIGNRQWKKAAAEGRDSRWYRQVTKRAERLMRRLEDGN